MTAAAPFAVLKAELLERMRTGELAHGARLPTVRALAEERGLAANTVARVYRELEADGTIETRGRAGSFVAWSADADDRAAEQAAAAYVAAVRALGVDDARAVELIRTALR